MTAGLDAIGEWAALAGHLGLQVRADMPGAFADYDAHVDRLLAAIEHLSADATDELVQALEAAL